MLRRQLRHRLTPGDRARRAVGTVVGTTVDALTTADLGDGYPTPVEGWGIRSRHPVSPPRGGQPGQ